MVSKRRAIVLAVCFAVTVCAANPASAGRHRIRFSAPGADITTLVAINSSGAAIGNWATKSPVYNGAYLRAPDGTFTDLRCVDASATLVFDINAGGDILGECGKDAYHGFIRSSDGNFTAFDLPAGGHAFMQTYINKDGIVAGSYMDSVGAIHAFTRSGAGVVAELEVPGGSNVNIQGIDSHGNMTGFFSDSTTHGFLRAADGTLSTVDVPGANATVITAMNANGDVAGNYMLPGDTRWSHGFIRTAGGTITTFAGEDKTSPLPTGLDDDGTVTGTYETTNAYWGFKYRAGRNVSVFHFCHKNCRTLPNAIKGGVIGGNFELWNGHYELKQNAFLNF